MSDQLLIRNFYKLNGLTFFWAFLVIQALTIPLFLDSGLSKAQAFSIIGVFSVTMTIFELPSGVLSDLLGRRRTLILAGLLKGVGGTLLIYWHSYVGFLVVYGVIGVANSLLSGTDISLYFETYEAMKKKVSPQQFLATSALFGKFGTAISSILGGVIAASSGYFWPLVLNSVFAWVPFVIALFLVDVRQRQIRSKSLKELARGVRTILFERRSRIHLIATLGLWGLITVSATWCFQAFWKHHGFNPIVLGILWAAFSLSAGLGAKLARYFSQHHIQNLIFIGGLTSSILLMLVGLPSPIAIGLNLLFPIASGLVFVRMREEINRDLDPNLRATINSLDTFLCRLLYFFIGPALGYLIDLKGFGVTFFAMGSFSLGVFVLLKWCQSYFADKHWRPVSN